MARKSLVVMGFLLCGSVTGLAQFVVTSSSPSDGAVSVPLSGTVSFTFNQPLDTSAHFGEDGYAAGLLYDADSLVIGEVAYSGDLRTMSLVVAHTANTDFVWVVIGARSQSGQTLALPYALNYTTAPTRGGYAVSGSVTYEGGSPAPGAIVALFDGPLFSDDEGNARSAAIALGAGGFSLPYVRNGVYWVVTAHDQNGDGEIEPETDLLGFYDSDADGQPDSLLVSGADVTGIQLELRQLFTSVTAREYLDQALTMAAEHVPDGQLRMVASGADTIGLDGTSFAWSYLFYSPSQDRSLNVIITSFFSVVDTQDAPQFPPNMREIPSDFVDSDVAVSVAEANGGSQFRALHPVEWRAARGAHFYWIYPQDTTRVFWMIEYGYEAPDSVYASWRAFIDIETGQLLYADPLAARESRPSEPRDFTLHQNHPNPFNPETAIQLDLARAAAVTLRVYDVQGRWVATLIDNKPLSAGMHVVSFDGAGLSSGVYLYRLDFPGGSQSRKMVLLK